MNDNKNCDNGVCEIGPRLEKIALQNLERIQEEVRNLCVSQNRKPDACRVLPATKTISAKVVQHICQAGQMEFAENKVQELQFKDQNLKLFSPNWHFIGHLQTNKARECINIAKLIHSVDRVKLGRTLDGHLQHVGKSMDILVQVNTSGEASKFGVSPDETLQLIRMLQQFKTLKIKGLMTLALLSRNSGEVRKCFRQLRTLADHIRNEGLDRVEMSELSMGMSSDYRIAVEEGATIVRIGQAIFGPRLLPDSCYWNEKES